MIIYKFKNIYHKKHMKKLLFLIPLFLIVSSCTTTKKLNVYKNAFNEMNDQNNYNKKRISNFEKELESKNIELKNKDNQIIDLKHQITTLENNSDKTISILKDLSVISQNQANAINESLGNLKLKQEYINSLKKHTNFIDSLNNMLAYNIKKTIGVDDKDVNIKIEKSAIFIDIADKLLFNSGSYKISERGKEILKKVSTVLNDNQNFEVMVEGNTDNVPYNNGLLLDNWDLSVKRATAVTRVLVENDIDSGRLIASGRGEFKPVDSNETSEGRQNNRRTRIIILPELDQFFKLLEKN